MPRSGVAGFIKQEERRKEQQRQLGGGGGAEAVPQPDPSSAPDWPRDAAPVPDANLRRCCPLPQAQQRIRREGISEAALAATRQAVGGGCQSGWGQLLSVMNAIEAGTWRQGGLGALEGGGGYPQTKAPSPHSPSVPLSSRGPPVRHGSAETHPHNCPPHAPRRRPVDVW